MNSKFLNLGKNDILKGVLIAMLTAIVTALYNALDAGTFEFTWVFFKPIVLSSIGAAMAYLLKNVLTNSDGKFAKPETKNNL